MAKINRIHTILMASCACIGLSACGADDIASPGEGTIVNALLPTAPLSLNRNASVTGAA